MSHAELDSRDMRSLNQLREESKALEKELMQLEQQLYNFEGSYLEETWPTGNVVRGFEGYVVNKNKKGADAVVTRKTKFKDTERIFSYSSESSTRAQQVPFEPNPAAPSYLDYPYVYDPNEEVEEKEKEKEKPQAVIQATKFRNVAFIDTNNPMYHNVFVFKKKQGEVSSDSEGSDDKDEEMKENPQPQ